ncbi:MAG: glycogen/starch synthase, partial [Anaerovoracaceae bacterium]
MNILFAASESTPLASSGGLGEVISSLPKALNENAEFEVRVIMPLHKIIGTEYRHGMKLLGTVTILNEREINFESKSSLQKNLKVIEKKDKKNEAKKIRASETETISENDTNLSLQKNLEITKETQTKEFQIYEKQFGNVVYYFIE